MLSNLLSLLTSFSLAITASAQDHGTLGQVYPVAESDPVAVLQKEAQAQMDSGQWQEYEQEMQERARAQMERPYSVEGIRTTNKPREFTFDPSYVTHSDIIVKGKVIHPQGTKVNPLDTVVMQEDWLLINGDDARQVDWAVNYKRRSVIILVQGAPLELKRQHQVDFFFDQGGQIVRKLSIEQVPALVTVAANQKALKVQELLVEDLE
jgi:conjugal transfer pilus assembly protein TraW